MANKERHAWALLLASGATVCASAQQVPDRAAIDAEALRRFSGAGAPGRAEPGPGNEKPAADYVATLESEGIPVEVFALEAHRPNVVARLTGNGSKRPLLLMAHTDTVNVDPAKWQHPPFSAARDGEHIYGRGTVDDKDSVTAALMTMLHLKRNLVSLDRDVIFLAEAGEEGNTNVGIEIMVNDHFATRSMPSTASRRAATRRVSMARCAMPACRPPEKFPKGIDLIAHGVAGHGSVPLESNPIARLARAIRRLRNGSPPSCSTARRVRISRDSPRLKRIRRSRTAIAIS